MKVCAIGPFENGTGYAKAGIEYIMSMHEVGIDVVVRYVKMTNTTGSVPEEFKSFIAKDLNNIDSVFQYNLPNEFSYKGEVQNIGGFAYETSNFKNSGWKDNLELMDKIVVPCKEQYHFSPFKEKTYVVPHSVDTYKFDKEYDLMDFGLPKDCFKFYTISEYNRRKNIPSLIMAYLSEFTEDDNVVLIIKAHLPSRNNEATSSALKEVINDFKSGLRRFNNPSRYPKIILLTGYLSDDQIYSLHKTSDVFVSASHGEAWCLPAVDALGFGNPVIATNCGAFKDYIVEKNNGFTIRGQSSKVIGVLDAPEGLYTGDETWTSISTDALSRCMRAVYEDKIGCFGENYKEKNRDFIKDTLSRKIVGNKLKEVLNAE